MIFKMHISSKIFEIEEPELMDHFFDILRLRLIEYRSEIRISIEYKWCFLSNDPFSMDFYFIRGWRLLAKHVL